MPIMIRHLANHPIVDAYRSPLKSQAFMQLIFNSKASIKQGANTQLSKYIRTSWMLHADDAIRLPDSSSVRFFTEKEADDLVTTLRKRNVFARHSRENSFYLQRARELGNNTIIEVYRSGDPDDMIEEASQAADLLEKLVILSTTFSTSRKELQRYLAVSEHRHSVFDLTIGKDFNYLRSKSRRVPTVQGIKMNEQLVRRFERCGFPGLFEFTFGDGNMSTRIKAAIAWLFESRLEPGLTAAIVKTSIAFESLLIFSESESLASTLAERSALMLGSTPDTRHKISDAIKHFYDSRSSVVHGGRRKSKYVNEKMLETADRMAVLLCLVIAHNQNKWASEENVRDWCEYQRWGSPATDVVFPFPARHLSNALALC